MNPLFPIPCDHGAATHSCIMHDTGRGTLCKNAPRPLTRAHARYPINRQRIVLAPITKIGRRVLQKTRATLRTSLKVKVQGHKLTLSVRLVTASS